MTKTESTILALIVSDRPELEITSTTDLLSTSVLDSFGIAILVVQLEANFQITIPGHLLLPENFLSIQSIAALCERLNDSSSPL